MRVNHPYYCKHPDCSEAARYMVYQIVGDGRFVIHTCEDHQEWAGEYLDKALSKYKIDTKIINTE